jgi:hypothetical protein
MFPAMPENVTLKPLKLALPKVEIPKVQTPKVSGRSRPRERASEPTVSPPAPATSPA